MPKWPDKGRYKAKRKDKQLNGRRLSEGRKKKEWKTQSEQNEDKMESSMFKCGAFPHFSSGSFCWAVYQRL